MIIHTVLLDLAEAPGQELTAVMEGLAALIVRIDGFASFEHGPNRDYENLSKPFSYGFVGRFSNEAALQTYAQDPEHRALGKRLLALCRNGVEGLQVSDLEIEQKR